jgi:outer membrane protein assembly factor BamD (BamD/ComL family)
LFEKIKTFLQIRKTKKQLQKTITDYRRLINLYSEILKLVNNNEFDNAQAKLNKFFRAYKNVTTTNTDNDKLQKEITKIDNIIKLYSQKYNNLNIGNKNDFLNEFTNIGNLLLQKIKFEKEKNL